MRDSEDHGSHRQRWCRQAETSCRPRRAVAWTADAVGIVRRRRLLPRQTEPARHRLGLARRGGRTHPRSLRLPHRQRHRRSRQPATTAVPSTSPRSSTSRPTMTSGPRRDDSRALSPAADVLCFDVTGVGFENALMEAAENSTGRVAFGVALDQPPAWQRLGRLRVLFVVKKVHEVERHIERCSCSDAGCNVDGLIRDCSHERRHCVAITPGVDLIPDSTQEHEPSELRNVLSDLGTSPRLRPISAESDERVA